MPPITDDALRAWLRDEAGIPEYRRIVREGDISIVVSKFEAGFSQDLFATVDLLPELFDDNAVRTEYLVLARAHLSRGEAPLRTAVWREASEALMNRLGETRGIDAHRRMYVLPGIESVQALIDTILWSAPAIDDPRLPHPGEIQAFQEFEAREESAAPSEGATPVRDIFTRYYGVLEGRRVENYCPGAPFGRRLVVQAWRICTETPLRL